MTLLEALRRRAVKAIWPALSVGAIVYFGYHAVHEEWKRRGAKPAFLSALTGVAGAAALQRPS